MLRIPTRAFWWFCYGLYAVGGALGYSLGISSSLTAAQGLPISVALLVTAVILLGVGVLESHD